MCDACNSESEPGLLLKARGGVSSCSSQTSIRKHQSAASADSSFSGDSYSRRQMKDTNSWAGIESPVSSHLVSMTRLVLAPRLPQSKLPPGANLETTSEPPSSRQTGLDQKVKCTHVCTWTHTIHSHYIFQTITMPSKKLHIKEHSLENHQNHSLKHERYIDRIDFVKHPTTSLPKMLMDTCYRIPSVDCD